MRRALFIGVLLSFSLLGLAPLSVMAQPNVNSPLGVNFTFFRNAVSEWSSLDTFKQSRPWIPQCASCNPFVVDTGESNLLDLDANGWMRSLPQSQDPPLFDSVATLMLDGIAGHYPAGQYIVLYDGEGTMFYEYDAVKDQSLSTPGRDVLNVAPSNKGIRLRITVNSQENLWLSISIGEKSPLHAISQDRLAFNVSESLSVLSEEVLSFSIAQLTAQTVRMRSALALVGRVYAKATTAGGPTV